MDSEKEVLKKIICECRRLGCTTKEILSLLVPLKPSLKLIVGV